MKRFVLNSGLFALPFAILVLADLFVLPTQFFTFRAWEALSVHALHGQLTGPFYPRQTLTMIEEGDLGHGTRFAVRRRSEWKTDAFGFRFDPEKNPSGFFNIVIVGDSFTVGAGLNQSETLNSALERRVETPVYPYAPCDLAQFMADPRFQNHFPPVVILEVSELYLGSTVQVSSSTSVPTIKPAVSPPSETASRGMILMDRFLKAAWFHALEARLPRSLNRWVTETIFKNLYVNEFAKVGKDGHMLFHKMEIEQPAVSDRTIDDILQQMGIWSQWVRSKGGRLIFLPVPMKSTVYFENAGAPPRDFLPRLIERALAKKLEIVDLFASYRQLARDNSIALYGLDETHWNSNGVDLAADLLAQQINTKVRRG